MGRKLRVLDELLTVTRRRESLRRGFVAGRAAGFGGGEAAGARAMALAFEEVEGAAARSAARLSSLAWSLCRNAGRASALSQGVLARARAAALVAKRQEMAPVEAEAERVASILACHAVYERRRAALERFAPQPALGTAELSRCIEHERAAHAADLDGRGRCVACGGWLTRGGGLRASSAVGAGHG